MMNVAVDLKPFFQMIFNMYVLCLQIQFLFVHMVVYFVVSVDYMLFSVCNVDELVCRLIFISG